MRTLFWGVPCPYFPKRACIEVSARAQLWPQVFGHVITALVMFQLFMIGILAVKQSYTSSVVVPLLFITAIFTMVCRSIFERPFQVMSLRGAVDLDKHEEVRRLSCGDSQPQHGSLASTQHMILSIGGLSPADSLRRRAASRHVTRHVVC